jgi:hypothetical protein
VNLPRQRADVQAGIGCSEGRSAAGFEQCSPFVQSRRNRSRGRDQRSLLPFAKKALHLQDIAIADPGDHQQDQREQQDLGAQTRDRQLTSQALALQR